MDARRERPPDTEPDIHIKMQRALSTHLFANHRLTTVWLDRIWNAGIPLVEIFCARQHLDYRDKAQIAELGHWFRDAELKVHSLHSPMYTDDVWGRSGPQSIITITEPVKSKRLDMVDEIKRALEIAETVPFRYLIQHLGVDRGRIRRAQNRLRVFRAGGNQPVRTPARRGSAARKHAQRAGRAPSGC